MIFHVSFHVSPSVSAPQPQFLSPKTSPRHRGHHRVGGRLSSGEGLGLAADPTSGFGWEVEFFFFFGGGNRDIFF